MMIVIDGAKVLFHFQGGLNRDAKCNSCHVSNSNPIYENNVDTDTNSSVWCTALNAGLY